MNEEYPITVRDRITRFCTTCQKPQFIYVQRIGPELKTCCSVCSRILHVTTSLAGISLNEILR